MKRPRLEQSSKEHYTAHAGLTLIGQALRIAELESLAKSIPLRHGIPHADILRSYAGLLAMGKTDFQALNGVAEDPFFKAALGIERMPSEARLRQRMDDYADDYRAVVAAASLRFLERQQVPVTPLWTGHAPLDMDLFPQDNSKTHKEGVSRTYAGYDGYGAYGIYLGEEGWNLAADLRPGKDHAQSGFLTLFRETLSKARRLTRLPLLGRIDSAHDALENRVEFANQAFDHILKWNPRKANLQYWLDYAIALGHWAHWEHPRPGKRIATFTVYVEQTHQGRSYTFRRVMRVIERTIDKHGQSQLVPKIEVEGWWTSLELPDHRIIALYEDHGTSEQYHSDKFAGSEFGQPVAARRGRATEGADQFKTDLDLERLPSGKLRTNRLIMELGGLIYNLLRWLGLNGLLGEDAPVRHPAKRRRLRTVMQELIGVAARVYQRSRSLVLRFGKYCPVFQAFRRVEAQLNLAGSG